MSCSEGAPKCLLLINIDPPAGRASRTQKTRVPGCARLCACFACGEPQRAREQRPAAQTRRLRARAASAAEAGRVRAERKIRPPPRGGPPSVMLGSGRARRGAWRSCSTSSALVEDGSACLSRFAAVPRRGERQGARRVRPARRAPDRAREARLAGGCGGWWGVGGCEGAVRAWIEVGTRRTQCLLQAHAPPLELSRDPGRAPDGVRQPEFAAPRRDDRRDGASARTFPRMCCTKSCPSPTAPAAASVAALRSRRQGGSPTGAPAFIAATGTSSSMRVRCRDRDDYGQFVKPRGTKSEQCATFSPRVLIWFVNVVTASRTDWRTFWVREAIKCSLKLGKFHTTSSVSQRKFQSRPFSRPMLLNTHPNLATILLANKGCAQKVSTTLICCAARMFAKFGCVNDIGRENGRL